MQRMWMCWLALLAGSATGCGDDAPAAKVVCPAGEKCPLTGSERYTYKELSQEWWKWTLSIPTAKNPMNDTDGSLCGEQQPTGKPYFFLSSGASATLTKRACKIPSGKGLFFPVLTLQCTACKENEDCQLRGEAGTTCKGDPQTDEFLTSCAADSSGFPDGVAEMSVAVDKQPVEGLTGHRVESGLFTITGVSKPEEQLPTFYCTTGSRKAAADGYWVFLEPMAKGSHTVTINAKHKQGYEQHVEYTLDVQ